MPDTTDLTTAQPTSAISITGFSDSIERAVSEDGYFATFSTEDIEGRKRLFSATQSAKLLREFMNTPIAVVDLVFAPTTISDDEGFAQNVLGVYLVDADGNSYVSSSKGVCKSALAIISQLGNPSDWGGPLNLMCVESNTAKGRRYKSLSLC